MGGVKDPAVLRKGLAVVRILRRKRKVQPEKGSGEVDELKNLLLLAQLTRQRQLTLKVAEELLQQHDCAKNPECWCVIASKFVIEHRCLGRNASVVEDFFST